MKLRNQVLALLVTLVLAGGVGAAAGAKWAGDRYAEALAECEETSAQALRNAQATNALVHAFENLLKPQQQPTLPVIPQTEEDR